MTLAEYRRELEAIQLRHPSLTQPPTQTPIFGHDPHLAQTFLRSYASLDMRDPIDAWARTLLHRAAVCAPSIPIPRRLLLRAADLDPDAAADQRQADAGVHRLASIGLLERLANESLRLHRLLAVAVQECAADPGVDAAKVEVALMQELYTINAGGYPRIGIPYLGHEYQVAALAVRRSDTAAVQLLNELGYLQEDLGDYAAARPLYEQALTIAEQQLGPHHPATAQSLNNLAELLREQRNYAAARPLYERAVAISVRELGPTHPNTLICLNNLALVLKALGDYATAGALYERVLTSTRDRFGADHAEVVVPLNNLAALRRAAGAFAVARLLYEHALALAEKHCGSEHPQTLGILNNLAELLTAQGDEEAARPLYERALRSCYEITFTS